MKLFVDLHIHSCLSPCGDELMTPNNIVGMAFLKQLDAIAVCDHNTARNLPAIAEVAGAMGVLLLPGLELTTREEAHLLCYFPSVAEALAFSDAIYPHLPDTPNAPDYFGRQTVMNIQDEPVAEEPKLLISALDLTFEECARLCSAMGGKPVPAHINRGGNGVLNALGFLPAGAGYAALEVYPALPLACPEDVLGRYPLLRSSDAHRLEDISERDFTLEAAERTVSAVFGAICPRA